MNLDINLLLAKAKTGNLGARDVAEVQSALQKGVDSSEEYDLVYVLGRAGPAEGRTDIILDLLTRTDDPGLVGLCLQIVSRFWGMPETIRSEIICFSARVRWDTFGEVQSKALIAAGEYLKSNPNDQEVFHVVYSVAAEVDPDSADEGIRRSAFYALAMALGLDESRYHSSSTLFRAGSAACADILKQASKRLG